MGRAKYKKSSCKGKLNEEIQLTREMLTKKIHAARKCPTPAIELFLWSAP